MIAHYGDEAAILTISAMDTYRLLREHKKSKHL
jgi:hypothetical protein